MLKVAVVKGGRSPEREVSLESGSNAATALRQAGYEVIEFDGDENLAENLKTNKVDVVFIALHGQYGEDGTLQGMLEFLDIPYTGSGVLASSLAINKIKTKEIFLSNNIPTPRWLTLSKDSYAAAGLEDLSDKIKRADFNYPLMVKPANLGSTVGVTKAADTTSLQKGVKEAFLYDFDIIIEEFINGIELTVPIYGASSPRALPVIEIIPKGEFYTYRTKYEEGMSTHIIPARIEASIYKSVQDAALRAYQALMCFGFARVDIMLNENNEIFALEVNTIPGMTKTSLFPESALKEGITFAEVADNLVKWAIERHEKGKERILYGKTEKEKNAF